MLTSNFYQPKNSIELVGSLFSLETAFNMYEKDSLFQKPYQFVKVKNMKHFVSPNKSGNSFFDPYPILIPQGRIRVVSF